MEKDLENTVRVTLPLKIMDSVIGRITITENGDISIQVKDRDHLKRLYELLCFGVVEEVSIKLCRISGGN